MPFSNGSCERTFQSNLVPKHGLNRFGRDAEFPVRVLDWCHIHNVPLDGHVCGGKDLLNCCRNLRTDSVAGDESDCC